MGGYQPKYRQPRSSDEVMRQRDEAVELSKSGLGCWSCGKKLNRKNPGPPKQCRGCIKFGEQHSLEHGLHLRSMKRREVMELFLSIADIVADISDLFPGRNVRRNGFHHTHEPE